MTAARQADKTRTYGTCFPPPKSGGKYIFPADGHAAFCLDKYPQMGV